MMPKSYHKGRKDGDESGRRVATRSLPIATNRLKCKK